MLRKADVPAAGAALGADVPPRLRTMADIPALHRPWCAAVATGLLRVGGGWVVAGPALECWPPGDADLLAGWLAGLRAVCAAESYPQDEDSVRLLALALLTVLGQDGVPVTDGLWRPVHAALRDLCDRYDKSSREPVHTADRYYDLETGEPLAGLVALLSGFGAVTGYPGKPVITQDQGPDEALSRVSESMPGTDLDACLAAVQAISHPDAGALARAVAEFAASGAPTLPRDHDQDYPLCVEFRGDSPVEYWSEDDPVEPESFGLKEVNSRLAALGRETE